MNIETIDKLITAAAFGLPLVLSAVYALAMIRYEYRKGGQQK